MPITVMYRSPGLLCCAERLPGGRGYRFVAEPMLAPRPPESAVRALNRSLERGIRRHPEQYLWGYNRYKVPAGGLPPDARWGGDLPCSFGLPFPEVGYSL